MNSAAYIKELTLIVEPKSNLGMAEWILQFKFTMLPFLNLVVDRVKDGDNDGQQNFGDVPEMAMAAIMK